jgi:hypothetical protein
VARPHRSTAAVPSQRGVGLGAALLHSEKPAEEARHRGGAPPLAGAGLRVHGGVLGARRSLFRVVLRHVAAVARLRLRGFSLHGVLTSPSPFMSPHCSLWTAADDLDPESERGFRVNESQGRSRGLFGVPPNPPQRA